MKTQHTPGPWAVLDLRDIDPSGLSIANIPMGAVIARIRNDVSRQPITEEDISNARLIAAAPELLEACQNATEIIESLQTKLDLSAIIDATGMSHLTYCAAVGSIRDAIAKATGETK